VDPLFSSGVAFALNHAASAARVILEAHDPARTEAERRDLFVDYDASWHGIADSFALAIDQWYHAIAKNNPGSIYWSSRADETIMDIRELTFNALVDTAVSPDLLLVLTKGRGGVDDLDAAGPLMKALDAQRQLSPEDDVVVSLAPGVQVRESLSLEVPRSKQAAAYTAFPPQEAAERIRDYWTDPVANGDRVPALYGPPKRCYRATLGDHAAAGVKFGGEEARAMVESLREPTRVSALREGMTQANELLLRKLNAAGMLQTRPASA
jgi:hypothetical protein